MDSLSGMVQKNEANGCCEPITFPAGHKNSGKEEGKRNDLEKIRKATGRQTEGLALQTAACRMPENGPCAGRRQDQKVPGGRSFPARLTDPSQPRHSRAKNRRHFDGPAQMPCPPPPAHPAGPAKWPGDPSLRSLHASANWLSFLFRFSFQLPTNNRTFPPEKIFS